MSSGRTLANVAGYPAQRRRDLYGAEQTLLDRHVRPGMRVLELGCGGGRVTRALLERGGDVVACDLSKDALEVLREELGDEHDLDIRHADAVDLPFDDGAFELVVFAWNGLDWVHPEKDRLQALRETARVLVPGGRFVFSSHNPLGMILTWRGIRSTRMWRWRLRYVVSGEPSQRYFHDTGGLLLYQASPTYVISQLGSVGLELESMLGSSGASSNRLLLTTFSAWPYYVFSKPLAGSS